MTTVTTIAEIITRIPAITADAEASAAAAVAVDLAEIALLDRLIEILRPALRSLGTRPLISDQSSGGQNGCNPWQETRRATWRGIHVDNTAVGPSEDRRGRDTDGSYGGSDLFLRADGTWCRLDYEGAWSRWQGATSGWEAHETVLTTAEVVAKRDIDEIVQEISKIVERAGSRADATKAALDRAVKLTAIVALM